MKSKKSLLVLTILLILPAVAWASSSDPRSLGYANTPGQSGTNSNPHNLSNRSSNTIRAANSGDPYETQICVFCHTPHNATAESTLWGRLDPSRMGSFPTFDEGRVVDSSGNLGINDTDIIATTKYDATQAYGEYPNGATKLCLSCHDGVTAIGSLASGRNIAMTQDYITDVTKYFDPPTNSALRFDRTHPVSFVYTQAVVDYLNAPAVPGPGAGKTDIYSLPSSTSRIKLDSQDRLQCTACHDPHLDTNNGTTYTLPFWRNAGVGADENADFDLTCNECHQTVLTGTGHNI